MSTVQSIERAMKILELLSKKPKGLGVTEIHNELELPTTTIHRILSTLAKYNVVVKESDTDKYSLGLYLLHLTSSILENMDIRMVARPFLEELRDETNEVIHLCIHEEGEAVYIDKVENTQKIRISSQVGYRALMHCTGVGKALLAGMSEESVREIINKKGLPKFTETTITDYEVLIDHLKIIRERGYSIDELEHEENIRCIAAPIFDFQGEVIAGISIAGPSSRVTRERVERELVPIILEKSKRISEALGYKG
ncbi:IclR family transcriptional regulator [Alkalihalobacillus sp. MEB130]|uniref:IclR family transcriptional regulator n=1 Tax=Alkalihalobacillus sp. MEB130 TaxID=2976704 RepID=UPI0028E033B1|nr:IclR family transcriptional regulator [Alkalihalobacillus sp. MEB130]MDT8860353.1 IclR family transcriptional regulator [Alkalihalobacillus sp. MEB130]